MPRLGGGAIDEHLSLVSSLPSGESFLYGQMTIVNCTMFRFLKSTGNWCVGAGLASHHSATGLGIENPKRRFEDACGFVNYRWLKNLIRLYLLTRLLILNWGLSQ